MKAEHRWPSAEARVWWRTSFREASHETPETMTKVGRRLSAQNGAVLRLRSDYLPERKWRWENMWIFGHVLELPMAGRFAYPETKLTGDTKKRAFITINKVTVTFVVWCWVQRNVYGVAFRVRARRTPAGATPEARNLHILLFWTFQVLKCLNVDNCELFPFWFFTFGFVES